MTEHFRFPDIFLRRTKKAFVSLVNDNLFHSSSVFLLNMISIDSKPFETILAQNGNNTIGQARDEENGASQGEGNAHPNTQYSMCKSGDSISLICNNEAEEEMGVSIGGNGPGPLGSQGSQGEKGDNDTTGPIGSSGPSSVNGRVYAVVGKGFGGNDQMIKATTYCFAGDTVIGGGYEIEPLGTNSVGNIQYFYDGPKPDLSGWEVTIFVFGNVKFTTTAVCFDNP